MKYQDYNEKKQHGTDRFPIQYYHVDIRHPQYEMPLHWHREFELIRVVSGRLKLFLDNTEYGLCAGDVISVNCGTLHRSAPPDSCVYECIVCDLGMLHKRTSDTAGDFILPVINGDVAVKCHINESAGALYETAKSLFTTIRGEEKYYELAAYGLMFCLFYGFYSGGYIVSEKKGPHSGGGWGVITDLMDWIEENYSEHLTLKQLAVRAGFNEKYLCRLFKEFTGRTPIDYINFIRIENACHTMTYEKLSVTEAAIASGFCDMSYFSRTFKRYKGVTPREYRLLSIANGSSAV